MNHFLIIAALTLTIYLNSLFSEYLKEADRWQFEKGDRSDWKSIFRSKRNYAYYKAALVAVTSLSLAIGTIIEVLTKAKII